MVYLDDIVIFGSTFNKVLDKFRVVRNDLANAGGSIGLKKCVFLAKKNQVSWPHHW